MATVEERDAIRLESFLESDRRISNSLRRRFDSGALHPKNVLQCLMACAGPDTFILCGAAFWLAAGSIGKLVATNSMARMSAAIISAGEPCTSLLCPSVRVCDRCLGPAHSVLRRG